MLIHEFYLGFISKTMSQLEEREAELRLLMKKCISNDFHKVLCAVQLSQSSFASDSAIIAVILR